MKKIILKASLITLGALIAAGILIFSLWIIISPQSMATVSEKLGNYNFAVTCANLKFKYSDDTEDLARCVEDSILAKDDEKIVKYGEKLIARDDFDKLCAKRDGELAPADGVEASRNYKTYILSTLAVSQYREGNLEKAVATAERGGTIDCFRKLLIEVVSSKKQADIDKVQTLPTDPDLRESVIAFVEIILGN